jgi:hypothetical protein
MKLPLRFAAATTAHALLRDFVAAQPFSQPIVIHWFIARIWATPKQG